MSDTFPGDSFECNFPIINYTGKALLLQYNIQCSFNVMGFVCCILSLHCRDYCRHFPIVILNATHATLFYRLNLFKVGYHSCGLHLFMYFLIFIAKLHSWDLFWYWFTECNNICCELAFGGLSGWIKKFLAVLKALD